MAIMARDIYSFHDAETFLQGKESRKIGHNTYVIDRGECIVIRYHSTDIVRYYPDGWIVVDTEGWQTVTTFDRLKQLSPFFFHSEGDGDYAIHDGGDSAPFIDGIWWHEDCGFDHWWNARVEYRKWIRAGRPYPRQTPPTFYSEIHSRRKIFA